MLALGLKDNNEPFNWKFKDVTNARLGVVASRESETYQKWIQQLLTTRCKEDPNSTFYVTANGINYDGSDVIDILENESVPTGSDESEEFKTTRMQWVQKYMDLLAYKYERERAGFIPLSSYRANIEGPLKGYERAIGGMEEGEDKEKLQKELELLNEVTWGYKKDLGYVFNVDERNALTSFYQGLWSFWLLTATMTDPRDLLLVVEIPKSLNRKDADPFVREMVSFLTHQMNYLTFNLTLSVIVVSENVYPIPETLTSQLLFMNNQAEDFLWEHQKEILPEEIIEAWENEKDDSLAMYADMQLKSRETIKLTFS